MVPEALRADFAEVCGIHAGDGWMSSYTNEIGYGTNPKEEQYFQDVLQLYKRVFRFEHHRILRRLAVELRFQSKEGQALLQSAGFVRGKKLDALRVPAFVFQKEEFMRRFLRGVVDTDGHGQWRRSWNVFHFVITWSTTSARFADDLENLLMLLKYHPHTSSALPHSSDRKGRRRMHRIVLIRKADIKRFIEEIGFRNTRRWEQLAKNQQDIVRYDLDERVTSFLRGLRIAESNGPVV